MCVRAYVYALFRVYVLEYVVLLVPEYPIVFVGVAPLYEWCAQ